MAGLAAWLAAWLVAGLLSGLLAACTGGSGGDDGPAGQGDGGPVTLAVAVPWTGPEAEVGAAVRDGALLAVEEANGAGERFTLREVDTSGGPAAAAGMIAADAQVVGVVGPVGSAEARAMLPALQAAGLVVVSPSASSSAPELAASTVFRRLVPDDRAQARSFARYARGELGATRVALFRADDPGSEELAGHLRESLAAEGLAVVLQQAVSTPDGPVDAARSLSPAPDLLVFAGPSGVAAPLRRALTEAGLRARLVVAGVPSATFWVGAGPAAAKGSQALCPCPLATPGSEGRLGDFARAYEARFGRPPGPYAAEGYDAARLLVRAALEGHRTRSDLVSYLASAPTAEGVSGRPDRPLYVYDLVAGGLTVVGSAG